MGTIQGEGGEAASTSRESPRGHTLSRPDPAARLRRRDGLSTSLNGLPECVVDDPEPLILHSHQGRSLPRDADLRPSVPVDPRESAPDDGARVELALEDLDHRGPAPAGREPAAPRHWGGALNAEELGDRPGAGALCVEPEDPLDDGRLAL